VTIAVVDFASIKPKDKAKVLALDLDFLKAAKIIISKGKGQQV
jgi:hypothetical protein